MSASAPFTTLTRKTAILMAIALIIAGSIPAAIVTALLAPTVATNSSKIDAAQVKADSARDTTVAIVNSLKRQCQSDHKFRIQYKIRGKAEKKLLALFLSLAQDNIQAGRGGPHQQQINQDFIKEFRPLLRRIHIIPVPRCANQAQRLTDLLAGTKVPEPVASTP